eukprot:1772733-Amphidinium_carterae.2
MDCTLLQQRLRSLCARSVLPRSAEVRQDNGAEHQKNLRMSHDENKACHDDSQSLVLDMGTLADGVALREL